MGIETAPGSGSSGTASASLWFCIQKISSHTVYTAPPAFLLVYPMQQDFACPVFHDVGRDPFPSADLCPWQYDWPVTVYRLWQQAEHDATCCGWPRANDIWYVQEISYFFFDKFHRSSPTTLLGEKRMYLHLLCCCNCLPCF